MFESGFLHFPFERGCVSKDLFSAINHASESRDDEFAEFSDSTAGLFGVIAVVDVTGRSVAISPNVILILPILIGMGLLALGLGCLVDSATVKYRDLNIVVGYVVQLWMYGSLVIYPRSLVPPEWRTLMAANPMASFIEWYRASLFTTEHALPNPLLFAIGFTIVVVIAGVWCFVRAEGTFTDSL